MSDDLSPTEVRRKVKHALDGIDPDLGAFITVDADAVLRDSVLAAPGRLRGLTVGVKDLIDTAGLRTTYGSPRFRYHVPNRSAPVVTGLERLGALVIGKTNLNEFAYGVSGYNPHYGLMRVPTDPTRTPGGSSGGSAVAVAAGVVDIGVGTDTGGSVRIPAACCGVIGYKCAHGAVPMKGVYPLAPDHDSIGYLVRSHEVLRRVLNIASLPDPARLIVDHDGLDRLPTFPADAHWATFREQSYAQHLARSQSHPDEFGEDLKVKLAIGLGNPVGAAEVMTDWRRSAAEAIRGVDVITMPVFHGEAPTVDEVMHDYHSGALTTSDRLLEITPIANALGWPAMVVPTADGPRQVLGPPGSDAAILAVGQVMSSPVCDP